LTWAPAAVASPEERFTSGEIKSKPAEASAKPAGKRRQSRRKENPSGWKENPSRFFLYFLFFSKACADREPMAPRKLLFQRRAPPSIQPPTNGIARILVFEKDLPENLGNGLRLGPDLSSRLPIR
jgi:hypothetical protein